MDVPSGFRQSSGKKKKSSKSQNRPQLFEDTSVNPSSGLQQTDAYYPPQHDPMAMHGGGYGMPQNQFLGQQYMNDPMANMAVQYGTSLAGQGKEMVNKNLEKYVSASKIKYYFAVDTAYVGKKLALLTFPFTHSDWSIRYNEDEPIAPRYDHNAPDLYIPVMAFVTYILTAGFVLGTQDRFTPEQLGIQASSALVWIIIEVLAMTLSLYVMNMNTELKYLDTLAYCGYKYVGMIMSLLAGLLLKNNGYYSVLLWYSLCIVFFLIRTLRVKILPHQHDGFTSGSKRSLYLILTISAIQPLMMWWLTSHIMFQAKK
ncbi:protein YIF1B-B [Patella vulgata]|uniref:protein YIF1B-B n=1 Tax=Patella vulgata TaxID=6465 RepID=UPI00217FE5CB|nr:protein YIF1B-B [Patella vulgata]